MLVVLTARRLQVVEGVVDFENQVELLGAARKEADGEGRSKPMSEKYISASKLKAHYSWLGKDATLTPKDFDNIIDAQQAADVEPVVRGELRINDQGFIECSACGKTLRMPLTSTYEMKRCYICGAYLERSGSGE